jgi:PAS domain S-box-containing protein
MFLFTSRVAADDAIPMSEHVREHMSEIIDSISDPFVVLDNELRIMFTNRAGAQLAGREPSELIGKRPWEVMAGSEGSAFHAAYRRALANRQPEVVEDYVAELDRWFEARVYPLGDGLSVYTRDVTAQKRSTALVERVARHVAMRADVSAALADAREVRVALQGCCEALVAHLGVAFARLWTVDDAGTTLILQASAGMYTHVDGPHGAVPVGKFKIGLIAEERRPHLTNDVPHDPRVGNPEWAARERMVAFAGYPLLVDNMLVGVLAMFSREPLHEDTLSALASIADAIAQGIVRRRAELELEQRVEELARSNADLEQFAYVASHDLQEPLRMISSYTQLLARRYKGKLDQDADDFVGFVVEGVTRMQRLINDLLAYSRVNTRGAEFVDVDLERVFADALANLAGAITEAGAEVTHEPLPTVRGDANQLGHVMQNVISNAVKFRGDRPPRVHVAAKRDGGKWIIAVQDNGIGIDTEYLERVFIIFQRLHPREQYPGTGIGLSIAKKIVERHGGAIWIESTVGQGTTVSFSLPERGRRMS